MPSKYEGCMEAMTSATEAKSHYLLKRLFSASRSAAAAVADKITNSIGIADLKEKEKDLPLVEPSSVCLEKMVQNFLEESNEKPPRCGRRRCSYFNGNRDDRSDDDDDEVYDYDDVDNFCVDATNHRIPVPLLPSEILKSLVPYATTAERNLLAVAARIVADNNNKKIKTGRVEIDVQRKILVNELSILEWDAAICISHWETTPAFPSGKSISNKYEYIDVMIEGEERSEDRHRFLGGLRDTKINQKLPSSSRNGTDHLRRKFRPASPISSRNVRSSKEEHEEGRPPHSSMEETGVHEIQMGHSSPAFDPTHRTSSSSSCSS